MYANPHHQSIIGGFLSAHVCVLYARCADERLTEGAFRFAARLFYFLHCNFAYIMEETRARLPGGCAADVCLPPHPAR